VTSLLHQSGITFICLKGPILSLKIYGDPTYRYIGDFDFLLPFPEVDRAANLLFSQGYQVPDDLPSVRHLPHIQKHRNQILLHHPESNMLVELHWRLLQIPPVKEELVDRLVQENLKEVVFSGQTFMTLCDELDLLFLIIHGGQHNWFRLKWLEDVRQITRLDKYDPVKFTELVNTCQAQRMVALCRALLQHFYPGEPLLPAFGLPSRFGLRFARSRINAPTERQYDNLQDLIRYAFSLFTNFPGIGYKLRVIRFILYSLRETKKSNSAAQNPFRTTVFQPLKFLRNRYRLGQ